MRLLLKAVFLLLLFVGQQGNADDVQHLVARVVAVLPHDPNAFTQGLAIHQGKLYESTGLYGQSSLKEIDLQNGQVIRQIRLPSQYFAEGLAIHGNQIILLTWREQKALVYNLDQFKFVSSFPYQGEGWGLCRFKNSLLMSNGSPTLFVRNPETFALVKHIQVSRQRQHMSRLNDLECVDDVLYANVWRKEIILKVDMKSGQVLGIIDASHLLSDDDRNKLKPEDVLNGIAYHPERGTFFLTGKRWPKLFEVQFVAEK